ncbi:MAG: hypothetical protein IJ552_11130 [Prevotella sp.]|nr:hypothetical protein [Prevotella sp.]
MKKIYLFNLATLLIVAMLGIFFASCSKNDDSVSDPEGTVSAVLSDTDGGLAFFNNEAKLYVSTTNSLDYSFGSSNHYIDINDCGNMNGLGTINSIPTSGWVSARKNPEVHVGHGYVIRYSNPNYGNTRYARMYITNKADHGFYVKYQTPFDPSKEQGSESLKSPQMVRLKGVSLTAPLNGSGEVIYEDSKYRYKIAAVAAHYFCLYPYYKDGNEWKIACSNVYDEVKVDDIWLCNLSKAINNVSLESINQKFTNYSSTPSVIQPDLGSPTGFYAYITTEDGSRKNIRFCSTSITLNHDQKSSNFGYIESVDMYYQEY